MTLIIIIVIIIITREGPRLHADVDHAGRRAPHRRGRRSPFPVKSVYVCISLSLYIYLMTMMCTNII